MSAAVPWPPMWRSSEDCTFPRTTQHQILLRRATPSGCNHCNLQEDEQHHQSPMLRSSWSSIAARLKLARRRTPKLLPEPGEASRRTDCSFGRPDQQAYSSSGRTPLPPSSTIELKKERSSSTPTGCLRDRRCSCPTQPYWRCRRPSPSLASAAATTAPQLGFEHAGRSRAGRRAPDPYSRHHETAHGQLPTGGIQTLNLPLLCTEGADHLIHPLAGRQSHRRDGRRGAAAEI